MRSTTTTAPATSTARSGRSRTRTTRARRSCTRRRSRARRSSAATSRRTDAPLVPYPDAGGRRTARPCRPAPRCPHRRGRRARRCAAPPENALALTDAAPHTEVVLVEDAGHLATEPPIERTLVDVTDRLVSTTP